jgi:pyrroloquinoline quinone (PQQ) biosynthesis protein C
LVATDTLISARDFCEALVLEASEDRRAMTKHPFVQSIAAGEASVDDIVSWSTGMYRLVADAQRWTAAGYAQCEDLSERVLMLGSLVEEETGRDTGTNSHGELVADFLQALGQSRSDTYARSRRLGRRWQLYTDYMEFMGRCRPYWMYRGVSSLAGESQFPALCRLMVDAMSKRYSVPESGLLFWSVHIPLDEEHTSSAVKLLASHLDDPDTRRRLRDGIWSHMELRWQAWLETSVDFAD